MKKIIMEDKTIGLIEYLQSIVMSSFETCGYDRELGIVIRSKLPELAHYQSNGSFSAAKKYQVSPMEVAEKISAHLRGNPIFKSVSVAAPGFVNMLLSDKFIVSKVNEMIGQEYIQLPTITKLQKIIIDFGGANVAKPLHVGHLRSAIIGESIKRIGRFLGHKIISDVHLGDWGLH